jgi:hypothetical protein
MMEVIFDWCLIWCLLIILKGGGDMHLWGCS